MALVFSLHYNLNSEFTFAIIFAMVLKASPRQRLDVQTPLLHLAKMAALGA